MQRFYLTTLSSNNSVRLQVSDEQGTQRYEIRGSIGFIGATLTIANRHGRQLAMIRRTSTGLFPRFDLLVDNHRLGSIGLSLQLREILFVSGRNWLITGSAISNRYQVHHFQHLVLRTYPLSDLREMLEIDDIKNESLLILLAAFLDTWRRNTIAYRRAWITNAVIGTPALNISAKN
jgi:uncharacterized protein YxjI